jgi:hypothetical protein
LGEQWFELDLHFLSLGGGEIALGWWFEVCLVPYLNDTDKLSSVRSISIVTGYGKTRTRGRRNGDDGMRKRCRAMLSFMGIKEQEQPNLGRIHIDKDSLIELVKQNGGRIIFDLEGYLNWKEEEAAANAVPEVEQKIRARFAPIIPGSGGPPFERDEPSNITDEYRGINYEARLAKIREQDLLDDEEISSDADHVLPDRSKFQKGFEESVGNVVSGRDMIRQRQTSNYPERDLEIEKYSINRPQSLGQRVEHVNGRGWINEKSLHADPRSMERRGPTQDQIHDTDHNNSNPNLRYETDRETNNFRRDVEPDHNNGKKFNQALDEHFGFRGNHVNVRQEYDHHTISSRLDQHDRVRDNREQLYTSPRAAAFQDDDRDVGRRSGGSHPVQPRRVPDDYEARLIYSNDLRAGDRTIERIHYQGNDPFMGATQPSNSANINKERYRMNNFDQGYHSGPRESWRRNESANNLQSTYVADIDHGTHRGLIDERSYRDRQGDSHSYREDNVQYNQQVSGSFVPRDTSIGGSDSVQHYHEQGTRIFDEEADRKRQYNDVQQNWETNSNGNRIETERSTSRNSRGYALEPEPQRRRLS